MAATIPARNNPWLDWSNFDTTFFLGLDEVTSNIAFEGDNRAANIVGFTTFIESRGGYIELGYAFLDDTENQGRSYHNIAASYTRRYLNLLSNSVRMIVNTGQDGPQDDRTADGLLLLMENSFLTRNPYNVIPYVNLFAGFGNPQSAARLQGPLKNTGINFESDLLTGYPLLDDSGNNTYGAALGVDLLGNAFEQQLILEAAVLQVMGSRRRPHRPRRSVRHRGSLPKAAVAHPDFPSRRHVRHPGRHQRHHRSRMELRRKF